MKTCANQFSEFVLGLCFQKHNMKPARQIKRKNLAFQEFLALQINFNLEKKQIMTEIGSFEFEVRKLRRLKGGQRVEFEKSF